MNNFNRINYYLNFKEGYYYYIQILSRKKDNPDQKHVSVIRDFYVDDKEYFWHLKDTITGLCDHFNARAYIRLNIRSYRDTALQQLSLLADYIRSEQYISARSAFSRCAGKYNAAEKKLWVIDLDGDQRDMVRDVEATIRDLQKEIQKDYSVYGTIPTPNGVHIISNPFNMKKFSEQYPDIDVKKDNPTLLYYPKQ